MAVKKGAAYRARLKRLRSYLATDAFPKEPTKAAERKLIKVEKAIRELRGQAVHVYRPRNPDRKRLAQKQFGQTGLPLKVVFVPVFEVGDTATLSFKKSGITVKTKTARRSVERLSVPISRRAVKTGDYSADVKNAVKIAKEENLLGFNLNMGNNDSSRFFFRKSSSFPQNMIDYLDFLNSQYGPDGSNTIDKWLFGFIGVKVAGSRKPPKRFRSKRRGKERERKRKRARNQ